MLVDPTTKSARSKLRSRQLKYVQFSRDTGQLPILGEFTCTTLMRYVTWLSENGVKSGWKGCGAYVTAAVNWHRALGGDDPRDNPDAEYWWSKFRQSFIKNVAVTTNQKLPLRPAMLMAMARRADLRKREDLRDMAAFFLLYFSGLRICHVAVAGTDEHALRFSDLLFYPSLRDAQRLFVLIRSTKTRPAASAKPFWVVIDRQPALGRFCPVELVRQHFLMAYGGERGFSPFEDAFAAVPDDFLFRGSAPSELRPVGGRPPPARVCGAFSRTAFTAALRRRLLDAGLPAELLNKHSGISFRRGCLSCLGASGMASYELATHADHASVESSRVYMLATAAERARASSIIGLALQSAAPPA